MNAKSSRPNVNGHYLMVLLVSSILVFAGFLAFSNWSSVRANTPDINSVRSRYPVMVNSRIDSCSLCHTGSIPSLNAYGAAYNAAGRSPAALAAIESADSDGDGFSNLVEITSLTFPGSSADFPVAPTATRLPPTATAVPPTATRVPPTATAVPPTATGVPPTATTVPPTATDPAPTITGVPPTPTEVSPTATPGPVEPTPIIQPTMQPSPTPTCVKKDNRGRDEHSKDNPSNGKKNPGCRVDDDDDNDEYDDDDREPTPTVKPKPQRKNPKRGKYG